MKSVLFALPNQIPQPGLFGNLNNLKYPTFPPLGLMYIASVIEKLGNSVEIIDLSVFDYSDEYIFKRIVSADFVGINVFTHSFKLAKNLARRIKSLSEDILIIIGGPHCTFLKEKSLNDIPEAKIAVVLEGENVIKEIIKYLEGKRNLSEIPGIYYREGKEIKKGKPFEIIEDLDLIPFPARHLIDESKYGKFPWYDFSKIKYTSMITSRGCPFRCRFCSRYCNVFPRWGYRERSSENVVKELVELNDKYGFVTIVDDNFLTNIKRAHLIFDELIEYGTDILIQILGTRCDIVDRVLFDKMKRVNVRYITFGVESGNQDVLDFYNKKITLNQIRNTLKLADDFGFNNSATLILGAPIETKTHINNTIDFICSLPLDHIIVHILFYDMGSDLWVEAVKEGKISKDEFEVPSIIERGLSNFTYDELINYQNIVARKFYMRIKYIIKQIIKSINDKDSLRLKQIIRVLISLQFKNFLFPIDVHK
ncbi:hypothetical protein AYK24_07205 [Thermoplasmatales archaeon SG8-52-4]|nr:MAG: hypothetical protein AYK24_07205 [Thermoplasmatales archaeon SG8-52-4]